MIVNSSTRVDDRPRLSRWIAILVCLGVVPVIAHLAFSSLGFNPTDDGFILAQTRRILDGQVPHRDFITIRPALSPMLHIPLLKVFRDHVFIASRFVAWWEFAAIVTAWLYIMEKRLKYTIPPAVFVALAIIGFTTSAHIFPIMVWHTIDGLLLATFGILLAGSRSSTTQAVGYILVGCSTLCKQNFAGLIPILLAAEGKLLSITRWIWCLIPLAAYLVVITVLGGLPDLVTQLTTETGILEHGVFSYLFSEGFFAGVLFGSYGLIFATRALSEKVHYRKYFIIAAVIIFLPIFVGQLRIASGHFLEQASFAIFGLVLGSVMYALANELPKRVDIIKTGSILLCLAWCVSLSHGWNSPALCTGPLACFAIMCLMILGKELRGSIARAWYVGIAVLFAVSIVCFTHARLNHIYREHPARELVYDLGGVVRGLAGIKTNRATYAFLSDLSDITKNLENHRFCVLPDCSCIWVALPKQNPIPIEWPHALEISKPELVERIISTIQKNQDQMTVLLQKYNARSLALDRLEPVEQNDVVLFCRKHLKKVSETRFFEVYE